MDRVLGLFLKSQYDSAMKLAAESDILTLHPLDGPPPQHYIASFRARGLAQDRDGNIVPSDRCDVGIWLSRKYLSEPAAGEVLTYLGPHPNPWHPNFRRGAICVHLTPGMALVDILYTLFEMWTYKLYYTGDEGLNHAASQWMRREDRSMFPTDARPLKRRSFEIDVVETTAGGDDK
ncbi:MAG TPA: hypothetical protein VMZ92_16525 [Planctomycetota bacterium]|nr:hypothetical protein [Planctomycetota bacterium]